MSASEAHPGTEAEIESTADEHDSTEESSELPDDDLFHLLQNSRRRAVVRYLEGRSGTVRMRDVAEQVAAWEHDTTVEALTSDERQRVYIALYQSHLDALADAGVIEYNKARGVIEPKPALQRVAQYLEVGEGQFEEDGESWQGWTKYYVAASGVSTLLVGSSTTGLAFSTYLTSTIVGLLTVALFTTITLASILSDLL